MRLLPLRHKIFAALCGLSCLGLVACGGKRNTTVNTPESATVETAATGEAATASPVPTVQPISTAPTEQTTVLSETPDAGKSYVEETLFIGDSNTARYMMYADESGQAYTTVANNIGVVSMATNAIISLKCEEFKGQTTMYTIPDAVAMLKPKRIVIGFGTNDLAGASTDATAFIKRYTAALDAIKAKWAYADIIVSAIPPLDKQRENTNLTMTQVDAYNTALAAMCEPTGCYFLNTAEVLRDAATGWAKKDYTLSDGVHLSKTAVGAFFTYLRTHALLTEDRRPQPLGSIPTPNGSPVGLISSDPIAVRGAKVPVEFVSAGGGSLQGATSQMVKKGGTCSAVTAVADAGWKFSYWSASYGSVGGSSSIRFSVPSSADAGGVVVTAHFESEEHDHNYVEVSGSRTEPSCLSNGVATYECTICGAKTEKELPALGHQWDGGSVTVQPGPGTAGVRTYTCTRCGTTKTEEIAALPAATQAPAPTEAPATPAPTEAPAIPTPPPTEAPAHTHSYTQTARTEPGCETEGSVTYSCSCGDSYQEALPALGHAWDGGTVTAEPQVGVPGVRTYTCTRCSAQKTEAIEALPEPEAPLEPIASDAPSSPAPVEPPVESPTESPVEGG